MKDVDIKIQNLSKVEGHANVHVKVRGGKVIDVQIRFAESKRFFTQAIRGQSIDTLPQSVARICGTCSIAHTMCCIEALEKGLGVVPSAQTQLLKKLTMYGLMIRDHALHTYLFSLPDVFNKDSVLDFAGDQRKFLDDAFAVKKAGNVLSTAVAGRAVHAPYPQVGSFAQRPSRKELKACVPYLCRARERLFDVLEVYAQSPIDYSRKTNFVSLVAKKFDFLEGNICDTKGICILEKDFPRHLEKVVLPYSEAVGYKFYGQTYMIGALARLNLNKQGLHKATKKDAKKYLSRFPSNNIFLNNLAQCIEILHSIDHSLEIIEGFGYVQEKVPSFSLKAGVGVGVIEAPRGTLFYHLRFTDQGIIEKGDIVVPSQQNQVNMELDIKALVQRMIQDSNKEEIQYAMEKLIRAYDPCISCASHFLKVDWQ